MTWATEITADSPVDWWKFQSASSGFHTNAGTLVTGIVAANDAVSYQTLSAFWGGTTTHVMQGGNAFTVYCVFKAPATLANRTELKFQPANTSAKAPSPVATATARPRRRSDTARSTANKEVGSRLAGIEGMG